MGVGLPCSFSITSIQPLIPSIYILAKALLLSLPLKWVYKPFLFPSPIKTYTLISLVPLLPSFSPVFLLKVKHIKNVHE